MTIRKMLLASVAVAWAAMPVSVFADTADKRIALSNNYAGNSWRQAMLTSWEKVGDKAVEDGVVAAADAFTTAENQATEQAAQIQNMILQGYDAIVVNAASPTAINGAVKEACDAGIVVVSFDGIVTEPCAWRIAVDFKEMGRQQVEYLSSRLPDGGNLLEIRGLAGVFVDDEIHAGIEQGVSEFPKFEIVGSVHGDWAQDVAQKAVAGILPSLPEIVGVVTQGGDGYGAAQAIKAAGRDMPIIVMGNRQDEMKWWAEARRRQRLRDPVAVDRAGCRYAGLLGRPAGARRRRSAEGPDGAVPEGDPGHARRDPGRDTRGSVANVEYSLDDAKAVIAAAN
jgi:ribose transport system substrate-binding protein